MSAESSHSGGDRRLYVPDTKAWGAYVKSDGEKEYCFAKMPGEDFFHRLSQGEIYIGRKHEKYCLDCALRLKMVTSNRLFWQRRAPLTG